MSQHNQLAAGAQIGTAIGKLTGLGNEEEGTTRLSESLSPIIDPYALHEGAFSRGEYLWSVTGNVPAVAAELGFGGIRNTDASGIPSQIRRVMKVLGIVVSSAAANANFVLQIPGAGDSTDIDSVLQLRAIDTRWGPLLQAAALVPGFAIFGAAAAVQGSAVFRTLVPSVGVPGLSQFPVVVLGPDTECRVYCDTVNLAFNFAAWGRTRVMFPGEERAS